MVRTAALAVALRLPARGGDVRLARVPFLALAVVFFVYAFVTPDARSPTGAFDALGSVGLFARTAEQFGPELGHLPASDAELQAVVELLPPPPFLVQGVRPEHWRAVLHTGCTGPETRADGVAPGTFLYCLSGDRSKAKRAHSSVSSPTKTHVASWPASHQASL